MKMFWFCMTFLLKLQQKMMLKLKRFQNFKLMFVGVINTTAQKIISSRNNSNYMSEVLYLNELSVAQQFKSDEYIENSTFEQIKEKFSELLKENNNTVDNKLLSENNKSKIDRQL